MTKISEVRRREEQKAPEFPQWQSGTSNFFRYTGRILLWLGLIVVFLMIAYIQIFCHFMGQILRLFTPNHHVPFWFGILVTIFLFPVTLLIILIGALVKMLNK